MTPPPPETSPESLNASDKRHRLSQANLGTGNRLQRAAAAFWLGHLFWGARYCQWYPRITKRFWVEAIWFFSKQLRHTTLTNARRLAGAGATRGAHRRLARQTIASFFQFILDLGRTQHMTPQAMREMIACTQGEEHFHQAKAMGRGVIMATAHFGSFEVGMAALLAHADRIHVLFRPDPFPNFEAIRASTRQRMGVTEHSVDEGLNTWLALRDALAREEVVLIQADRAEPGQPGQTVPFYEGHIRVPTGPARLAKLTGAPIVPVFCYRDHDGQLVIRLGQPVVVSEEYDVAAATLQLARELENQVRQHPQQWLMLQPVWVEDQAPPSVLHDEASNPAAIEEPVHG